MIERDRIVREFMELTGIDSVSKQERAMADALKNKLQAMGLSHYEDNAGSACEGNTGNVICKISGNRDAPAIMLMAHMDTVQPGINKKRLIDGDIIRTDGTTILGADDVGGIVPILECVRHLREEKIKHGDIYLVFTIAEEIGMVGASFLDVEKIPAAYGFVMDSGGPVERVVIKAPYMSKGSITVIGKAAHAGISPESGINAIAVLADAISQMPMGRIDFETTANIGTIEGGVAYNIVCEKVVMRTDVRSISLEKLNEQIAIMKSCFDRSIDKFGAKCIIDLPLSFPGWDIPKNSAICQLVSRGMEKIGRAPNFIASGGGYDGNFTNFKGIPTVILSVGTEAAHTVNEYINIIDMVDSARLLVSIIELV